MSRDPVDALVTKILLVRIAERIGPGGVFAEPVDPAERGMDALQACKRRLSMQIAEAAVERAAGRHRAGRRPA